MRTAINIEIDVVPETTIVQGDRNIEGDSVDVLLGGHVEGGGREVLEGGHEALGGSIGDIAGGDEANGIGALHVDHDSALLEVHEGVGVGHGDSRAAHVDGRLDRQRHLALVRRRHNLDPSRLAYTDAASTTMSINDDKLRAVPIGFTCTW